MKHPVLQRQLRRLGLDGDVPPSRDEWARFLDRVGDTYTQADQDRYTLERSLSISSTEMQSVYEDLRRTSLEQLRIEREKVAQIHAARAELARSEANFKMLVDRSPHPVFVHQDSVFLYLNPEFSRLLGHADSAALIGASVFSLLHPDDVHKVAEYRMMRAAGEDEPPCQVRLFRTDGGEITIEFSSASITYDGAPATVVMGHDVTGRMRAAAEQQQVQDALRRSEERYHLLFDASPLPNFMFDSETFRFVEVNDAALELYGYSRDEFLELRLLDLEPAEDVRFLIAGIGNTGDGSSTYSGVHRHRRKDGSPLDVRVTSRPVVIEGRRAMLAFGVDVTLTRKLEEQLRQAQKMEAIGQLAGGVAHDFNNLLAIILAGVEAALEVLPAPHPAHEVLKDIETATERAASLTRQLLTFSRHTPMQTKIVLMDDAIVDAQRMLSRLIGEDIRIALDLQAPSGSVEVDPSRLEQVLLNLAVNARDAMPGGGSLTIETRNIELDLTAAAQIGVAPGSHVQLRVRDDGCGMAESTQRRIFEPFFTTKEVGRGTGLGLSTVFGIVQQSRGAIAVYSAVDRGTTFELYFPRLAIASDAPAATAKVRTKGGSETILLVEDDAQLRTALGRGLARRGYRVLEADCARAALALMAQGDHHIDLILTDVVMPGMDGRTMAEHVQRRHPGARVVFMSGYTEHHSMKGAPIGLDDTFLSKPFTGEALASAVRTALDAPSPSACP